MNEFNPARILADLDVPFEQHMNDGTLDALLFNECGRVTSDVYLLLIQGRMEVLFATGYLRQRGPEAWALYNRLLQNLPGWARLLLERQVDMGKP